MGLIHDKQSMALAWLGSGGADQMIGYVVSTWYGRGGWGTRDYFFSEPGRYTLSEAFFFNNQAIVYELQSRFPKTASVDFNQWNIETDPRVMGRLAAQLGYTKDEPDLKDNLGLHWDRDTVAFYGDPAWEARLAPQPAHFTQKLSVDGRPLHVHLEGRRRLLARPPAGAASAASRQGHPHRQGPGAEAACDQQVHHGHAAGPVHEGQELRGRVHGEKAVGWDQRVVGQAFQPDRQVRLESLTYGERRPTTSGSRWADYA